MQNVINKTLSELTQALLGYCETNLALCNIIPIGSSNFEEILTKWYLIQQQPLLNLIFKKPPMISHRNE